MDNTFPAVSFGYSPGRGDGPRDLCADSECPACESARAIAGTPCWACGTPIGPGAIYQTIICAVTEHLEDGGTRRFEAAALVHFRPECPAS